METREASPAHLLIKIQSFSLLEKHGIKKFETTEFESGGYKWKLIIYPSGKERDEGYVSVDLAIQNVRSMPAAWEVNAVFTICLFNQIIGTYSYSLGRSRRFLATKTEWGFSKFISKKELNNPHNGYLSQDGNCVFGAEVFVNENKAVIDSLYAFKNIFATPYKKEWTITNFSKLESKWDSPEFSFGGRIWQINLYRSGHGEASGRYLSIYLRYIPRNNNNERLHALVKICMKNQLSSYKQRSFAYYRWFSAGKLDWGWPSFIELAKVNDPKEGFVVNDCCIIEVEISVQAIASLG
ncbi:TRAF-like family protein [Striga hermonthica]|uniref:TRAF-like family protein n=1 Tax=Striga hermonthica TaxID=68872 RepID=A0A9N7NQ26_STRHE|nr:TRAF-like family protein [Striga hermonthica]